MAARSVSAGLLPWMKASNGKSPARVEKRLMKKEPRMSLLSEEARKAGQKGGASHGKGASGRDSSTRGGSSEQSAKAGSPNQKNT